MHATLWYASLPSTIWVNYHGLWGNMLVPRKSISKRAICCETNSARTIRYALATNNLALVYRDLGDYRRAEALTEKASAILSAPV
jgi:hypothetical protein